MLQTFTQLIFSNNNAVQVCTLQELKTENEYNVCTYILFPAAAAAKIPQFPTTDRYGKRSERLEGKKLSLRHACFHKMFLFSLQTENTKKCLSRRLENYILQFFLFNVYKKTKRKILIPLRAHIYLSVPKKTSQEKEKKDVASKRNVSVSSVCLNQNTVWQ